MTLTHLLLTVTFASILWPAAARAQSSFVAQTDAQVAQLCSAMFGTEALAISIGPTPIRFKFELNNRQITEFINQHGGRSQGAMGMTSYMPDYKLTTRRNVLGSPVDGRWCWRDEIHVELARQPVVVAISSDYRHNECIQRAIHGHEMSHVSVFHTYLRYLASRLQELHGKGVGPVRASVLRPSAEPDDQSKRLAAIRDTIDRALPRIPEINDEVDSEKEVSRLWAEVAQCETPAATAPEPQKPFPARAAAPIAAPAPAPERPTRGPAALF